MSFYDLLIRNGLLVNSGVILQTDIAIANEQIVACAPEIIGSANEEIDAQGLYIFPGAIDAHVHFNDPGRHEWEGFETGSKALVAGGATACFDMPLNAHPPTLDAASFQRKYEAVRHTSYVDFAFWGGLVPENLSCLEELAECGVIGFKAFMSSSGIDDFSFSDDYTLYEGMKKAAELGKIVAVHAENEQITSKLAYLAATQKRSGIRDYLNSRPVIAELEAIERAILFAQETGCALHIVHISTGRGVRLVANARMRGINVSCETCPHYLVLTEEDAEELGAIAKCAPPLRTCDEQDALWQHLFAGTLPMVVSDHSPAPMTMKSAENFFQVWGGISGCQSTLQLLLTEGYHRRHLPLTVIASVTSEFIARRFRLPERKGEVKVGADADLVLIDMQESAIVREDQLFYRHKHSPYIGRTMQGCVKRTLVRGTTVFRDGQIVGEPRGHLFKPIA